MTQAAFTVRMDTDLKEEFDLLCKDFGMNATTAMNIFARAVVREHRIPFEISSTRARDEDAQKALMVFEGIRKDARDNGLDTMTLDDINKEIRAARRERKANGQ